MINSYKLVL